MSNPTQLRPHARGILDINIKVQVETDTTDDVMLLVYGTDGQILFRSETPSDMEAALYRHIEKTLEAGNVAPVKMVIV